MADLFRRMPDPQRPEPAAGAEPATPGSRRAAREAARAASKDEKLQHPGGQGDRSAAPASDPSGTPESVSRPGLDELFDTSDEDARANGDHPRPGKRRRGCLIALIIILAVLGGIAAGGVWAWNTYGDRISDAMGWGEPADWEAGQEGEPVLVTVRDGDTGQSISTTLFEAGVTKTAPVFYDYLRENGVSATFYPGVYELRERMTAAAALAAFEDPANKREHSVLLREGLTADRSATLIAEALGFDPADVEAALADPSVYGVAAESLEGWLFPAMYTFDPGATPQDVVARMVERTRESLRSAGVTEEDAQRVLTIASIIEREARLDEDFYRVSRVIYNRLDDGMKLQMDSTAQYGVGELHDGGAASSGEALANDNPWNTYVHTGLPAGPIANPGDRAIDAATHPADGPWLYFVTIDDATGETVFTATYAEHLEAVEQRQEWCRADKESRCP